MVLLAVPALGVCAPMTGPASGFAPPTPVPQPTATPAPQPTTQPPAPPETLTVAPEAQPGNFNLRQDIVGTRRSHAIAMPAQDGYAQVEGVLTFRGGPYRQNAAYGHAAAPEGQLEIVWEKKTGGLDNWGGIGWNGQPALVRWPDALRRQMNLYQEKKDKDGLVEAIYCALDGRIYFLDLDDGTATRDPIEVGFPMKGSVSIDPRGVPLLYSGQGISRLSDRSGSIGLRVFSLVDGTELFFINGLDSDAYRRHGAFDSVCLVDAESDTLIAPGENGLIYTYQLNTSFDAQTGAVSIDPVKGAYRYRNASGLGVENSIAVYGHYGYFADNGGMLHCIDLNTLSPVWNADVTDDTDASVALDVRPDGQVWLYTGCEVDAQGKGGKAYVRSFDALTGALRWTYSEVCAHDADLNGGMLGSPLVGTGPVDDLVYVHIAKVYEGGGALVALDKQTGAVVWRLALPRYGWSSPVAVYGAQGEAHILLGDSGGTLRLIDAREGAVLSTLSLQGNIEGSPAVFGDMLVVGTRGRVIYGIRIR